MSPLEILRALPHPLFDPHPVLRNFLEQQHTECMALANHSDLLALQPIGPRTAPTAYVAEFRTIGLVRVSTGEILWDRWVFLLRFPADYLQRPNTAANGPLASEMIAFLGPRPCWHPNFQPAGPFVCLHLRPGTPLIQILFTLHDLVRYDLVSTRDEGLNRDCSAWFRGQPQDRFPLDRRPLRRRTAATKLNLSLELLA